MSISVAPAEKQLTVYTIDEFLGSVSSKSVAGERVLVDLSKLEFIDLFAMICIIYCCADLLDLNGCQVELDVSKGRACSFLPRAGFFNALSDKVTLKNDYSFSDDDWVDALRGSNPALLELTSINSPKVIDDILDRLITVLRRELHYDDSDAYDLAIVFSELCQNVLDHNPPDSDGLAAMQVYSGRHGRFMQFVVADRGMGIRQTLQHNLRYAGINTDVEAISQSIRLGVSEYSDDPTRGNGLYHLLDLSFKHLGTVHIRSGNGKVYLRTDRRRAKGFSVPFLSGCQFSVSFDEKEQE